MDGNNGAEDLRGSAVARARRARLPQPAGADRKSGAIGLVLGLSIAIAVAVAFWFAGPRSSDGSASGLAPAAAVVDCPDEVPLGSSPLCGIVTANVVEARWEIEGFGSGQVEKIDTEWQMFINPTNAEVVGMDFELVVTALGRNGNEVTASHRFTVIE